MVGHSRHRFLPDQSSPRLFAKSIHRSLTHSPNTTSNNFVVRVPTHHTSIMAIRYGSDLGYTYMENH